MRQNNLKGFDLDIPLGRYVVVTGLSGAGKSSLVFETLHAEGQRRYVETFSAYTRQFLELLDKPKVDSIENIRPSIAIEQTNTVKSSRSTVGTMTELNDYFKVWFSHLASCYDPQTGERVEDDSPQSVWRKALASWPGRNVIVAFEVSRPQNLAWPEILGSLKAQAYVRAVVGQPGQTRVARIDDLLARPADLGDAASIMVVQDRVRVAAEGQARFIEATETAMHFGRGQVRILGDDCAELGHYSRGLHSPKTGRRFRPASPALFSFNSPLGACPRCRGFGRVIEIDYRLAIPDPSLSVDGGAIRCWEGAVYSSCKDDLRKFARKRGIPTDKPLNSLTEEQRSFVIDGEPGYGTDGKEWPSYWYGLKGFFAWLEKNTYKMHVRVFLSRYRSYNTCPDCGGARLQPEALCWRWSGMTLPQLYALPVERLLELVGSAEVPESVRQASLAHDALLTRLRYLREVGLGYLTLDRPSRTLSGGEVERVNLTSCLGTSLVDTLFVMDEPSVGLHTRDVEKLIAILRSLVRAGNTVVVVEHDEAMIRAADHVIEIGPEPGPRGGHVVFQGSVPEMLRHEKSITGAYFSGRRTIPQRPSRRPVHPKDPCIVVRGASKHNLRDLDVRIPQARLVCLSGVSGSGKSTLLDHVVYQGLLASRGQQAEDPAVLRSIEAQSPVSETVLVDQGPVSRTPRSNPALYTEAWDAIRGLFASTAPAQKAGMTESSFSFNSGDGRCDHCQGLGYERVEMQFLSDVFVPCPVCEGRRFKPEVLAVPWNGKSVSDILALSVDEALAFFAAEEAIHSRLRPLAEVGLGYLCLGQPLNTLSGGESQRLKLVRYLAGVGDAQQPALLLLDEPTTGLHRHDVGRLITVLQALVDRGHSLVVIEHNLDVLRAADWIIEMGPEAGDGGGRVTCEGTPEHIAEASVATAPFLRGDGARGPERAEEAGSAAALRTAIEVVGARENNLRDLSVSIPLKRMTVVTGVSGSGKSTLAFDIVFGEGQRRFMESMSPYARQFVEQMPRPSIDSLSSIPPAVAIEQRVTRGSLKSTVATITEVAQYLRLLYARIGVQHHPRTDRPVTPLSASALKVVLARVLKEPRARRATRLYLLAPLVRGRKGHHQPLADWLGRQGFELMRADGRLLRVDAFQKLDRYKEHDIEVVVADLKAERATGSALERALELGKGSCFLLTQKGEVLSWFSTTRTDAETGDSFPELDPKDFSFNSPRGWCPTCRGYGHIFPWMQEEAEDEREEQILRQLDLVSEERAEDGLPCPSCSGARLNPISRAVKLHFKGRRPALSLPALLALTPNELLGSLGELDLDERGRLVARDIVAQIRERLRFMDHVGLGYLSLDRPTKTLSGGEAQRIRLAAQLGTNLAGVLYVLDEPSIGLHARDNERLIATMEDLRDKGNTVLVVEHDDELMRRADRIIDLGPGAGIHGGRLLAEGTPAEIERNAASLTGLFLSKGIAHPLRGAYRPTETLAARDWIELEGAGLRNLKGFDLRVPKGRLVMVAGPSGAGKSTLFRDLLGPAVACAVKRGGGRLSGRQYAQDTGATKDALRRLSNAGDFRSVVEVDQSPIGKTPRSTPATYLGIFDLVRGFFASLPEAKLRGYTASRFSFNTTGGRCATCEGAGRIKLEMAFMPETYLPCDDCQGSRYGTELYDITWKGRTIGGVLALSFEEAVDFFSFHSELARVCKLMVDCGLGYLNLGQSSSTLSGGEAQRLKLVTELARVGGSSRGRPRGPQTNLYILEEPTIGLHLSDCEKLIHVLHALVDQGHTVIVIEHNLDLIAEADYVVELGPDGGPTGGHLIYQGPVAGLGSARNSPTAPYLATLLRRLARRR